MYQARVRARPRVQAHRRLPAELALELRSVDRVPPVVARPVRDEPDEAQDVFGRAAHLLGYEPANGSHDLDVRSLLASADVVRLADAPALDHRPHGLAVVFDVEPVATVLAGAVNRKLAPLERVEHRQWNELLGRLPRAVVIGAVRDRHGKPVRAVKRAHEVVR